VCNDDIKTVCKKYEKKTQKNIGGEKMLRPLSSSGQTTVE